MEIISPGCVRAAAHRLGMGEVRYWRRLNLVACKAFSASCVFDPLGS